MIFKVTKDLKGSLLLLLFDFLKVLLSKQLKIPFPHGCTSQNNKQLEARDEMASNIWKIKLLDNFMCIFFSALVDNKYSKPNLPTVDTVL